MHTGCGKEHWRREARLEKLPDKLLVTLIEKEAYTIVGLFLDQDPGRKGSFIENPG